MPEAQSFSILDLPEPLRSRELAALGMTADEFAAHQAGIKAALEAEQAALEAGEIQPAPEFHYGDDWPGIRVVDDPNG